MQDICRFRFGVLVFAVVCFNVYSYSHLVPAYPLKDALAIINREVVAKTPTPPVSFSGKTKRKRHLLKSKAGSNKAKNHTRHKQAAPMVAGDEKVRFFSNEEVAKQLTTELKEKSRYDKPDEAAAYFRLKRLPKDTRQVPVEKYLTAKKQMDGMAQYSSKDNRLLPARQSMRSKSVVAQETTEALNAWVSLGPGNIGGRTRALIIHPTNPAIMYAAGVAGGIWRTTNNGQNWLPLTDMMANLAVSCLAFDPKNPLTIYAGTGEGFFNGDALQGAGIFYSTDGGDTWQHLPSTSMTDFHYVNDIVVSPNNSQVLYVATDTGVWHSNDKGKSWVLSRPALEDELGGCVDLAIRTDQAKDYLFAAFGIARRGAVYRNLNVGENGQWEEVLVRDGMRRTTLAIAPSDQNTIYALAAGGAFLEANGLHAVLRSTSGGEAGSWTVQVSGADPDPLNRRILSNPIFAFLSDCGLGRTQIFNQSWYDLTIAVDPVDVNRVWVGGTDLFRSEDGGRNWGQASHWWIPKSIPQYNHADQHQIIFHPKYDGVNNKTLFVTNDGGLFRTDDARAGVATGPLAVCNPANSQVTWTALNHNYGVTQFYFGLPFPDGKSYLGGTQDNGTVLGSDALGINKWREINDGDGGYVAVDSSNPQVLYAEYTGLSIRKSTDGGSTFSRIMSGFEYFLGGDSGLFITPFTMDPSNPRVLYTGGIVTWRTVNAGAHWELIGESVGTGNGQVSAIAVAPTDSNYLLVGKSTGIVHRTQRALSIRPGPPTLFNPDPDWQNTYLVFQEGGFISSLTFDPADKNIAYATVSTFGVKHVWKSVNAGATWNSIDGEGLTGLPDIPVNCLVVDPHNTARLFVGTDMGVFASTDGGMTWAVENNGFANTIVESLTINTTQGESQLFAFTHGRGAWRVSLGTTNCEQPTFLTTTTCDAQGGEKILRIMNAGKNCPVSASSNADWVQILATTATEVRFQVSPQIKYQERTATITIGGRSHQVIQKTAIDTTPPQIVITSPSNGTVTNSSSVRVTFTVTDNDKVSFLQYGKDCLPGFIYPTVPASANQEVYVGLEAGVNTFCILGMDPAGNKTAASIQLTFIPEYFITTVAGLSFQDKFAGDAGSAKQAAFWNPPSMTLDSVGNMYIADNGNGRIRKIDAKTNLVSTIAGKGYPNGVMSSGDGGSALDAVFGGLQDVKVDGAGNIYILEGGRIRKITTDGIINTIVGDGVPGYRGDGESGTGARISAGYYLALDSSDNLYYADTNNNRLRKIDAKTGIITTVAGTGVAGFSGDGNLATQAQLRSPYAIAFDKTGNLYFTDSGNARVRKIQRDTGIISTIAGNGDYGPCETPTIPESVPALTAPLGSTLGIGVDAADNVYVSTQCRVRRITPDGLIKTIAGTGGYYPALVDNIPANSEAASAVHAIDASGAVYFAESWSSTIRKIYPVTVKNEPINVTINSPSATGNYTTIQRQIALTGTATSNGTIVRVRWRNNRGGSGVAVGTNSWMIPEIALYSGQNHLTVAAETVQGEAGLTTIAVKANPEYVAHRLAGTGNQKIGFSGDGQRALSATFWNPKSVAVDASGVVYVADRNNYRIRKVATDGTISTYVGTGEVGSRGDGGPATQAELNLPEGVVCDPSGNLYIADTFNHRIRKVTPAGIISTYAGVGPEEFAGDGGLATSAWLAFPRGLAIDGQGNLYFADAGNNRIRRVDARTGIITTVAGNGNPTFAGDGGLATAASLFLPSDVAVDKAGNLFIADRGNKRVRKVTANGVIRTILDESATNTSGESPYSPLVSYAGLKVDAEGNLYVTNELSLTITKITPTGESAVIAGSNGGYTLVDGSPATGIQLWHPNGIAIDRVGNLYVADQYAGNVWLISPYKETASVNGASYAPNATVGVESIVSVFGTNLAIRDAFAQQLPLPQELAGTTIKIRDSTGIERLAPLFYVSKLQINYQIPAGTTPGAATIIITNANGEISAGAVTVTSNAPGLFSASSDGSGWAAASLLYVKGNQRWASQVATCGAQGCNPVLIDLDAADEVYLEIYGTGIRFNNGLESISVVMGGERVPVLYAGAQCCFAGVDQINVKIPKSLAGRGVVDMVLSIDGKVTNSIKAKIK